MQIEMWSDVFFLPQCPKCNICIEKNGGCNHMVSQSWKSHVPSTQEMLQLYFNSQNRLFDTLPISYWADTLSVTSFYWHILKQCVCVSHTRWVRASISCFFFFYVDKNILIWLMVSPSHCFVNCCCLFPVHNIEFILCLLFVAAMFQVQTR